MPARHKTISFFSIGFISGVTASCASLVTLNLSYYATQRQKVLGLSTVSAQEFANPLESDKRYWQNIVQKSPTYKDAYLELAQIALEEGNKNEARALWEKAKLIDPNSINVAAFERKLR